MNPIQCLNTFEISLYTKTKKKKQKKQNKTKQKSTKDLKMILVMGS